MSRPYLTHLRLVTSAVSLDTRTLEREFPTLRVERTFAVGADDAVIDADEWRSATHFYAFDEHIERSRGSALTVRGERHVETVACEALTRYQRFVERRNGGSRAPMFEAALHAHRGLFADDKPLVKADFDHALDTWRWMLRLDKTAPITAQLAALFHDIERLESEADARVEHRAADYQAFKDAHAARGGAWAREVLRKAGVSEVIAERVSEIIAKHERRGHDPEVDLLNDADGLSFLSLNSAGYLDYFGPEQTRRKIAYTLERLGPLARPKMGLFRLRPDVRYLLQDAA